MLALSLLIIFLKHLSSIIWFYIWQDFIRFSAKIIPLRGFWAAKRDLLYGGHSFRSGAIQRHYTLHMRVVLSFYLVQ